MAKVKKKARKLVVVVGWAALHHDEPRPYVGHDGMWTIYKERELAKYAREAYYPASQVVPVEIRQLPAKKAGGGKKNG